MPDVSIKEVAKIAGVSIATVSRCINNPEKVTEKTRRRVQDAIRDTGYAPNTLAQSFRRGRTNLIMVVVPSVGNSLMSRVMRGIRRAAKTRGYSVLIEETRHNMMTADDIGAMVASKQTDGVILLASMSPLGTEILSTYNRRRPPIVTGFEGVSPGLTDFPSVQIDNVAAAKEATNYLISQGHERIGMIGGYEDSLLTRDREFGYRAAMKQAGLRIDDGWVEEGELTIAGARRATRMILSHKNRPTAIFCANDEMAIGCLHELKVSELRIPEDMSVVGFDDIRYASVTDPPLTTISQPAEDIGERVIYRLCREIEDRGGCDNEPEFVPYKLVVRKSVSPQTTRPAKHGCHS